MEETPQSDSQTPRRNSARERHLRRKQQGMAQPSNISRQLKPSGGFELPEVNIPINRLVVYGGAAVVFLIVVIMLIGRLKNDAPKTSPNAIWIGTQWTYDSPDDAALTGLVQKLRDHHVGVVYAWVSLLQSNNAWSDTNKLDAVKSFVQRFKRLYPEVKLYGWLSIDAQPVDSKVRLEDTSMQQIVADFSQRMTAEFKFDGVMLNVIPVFNNDENYLAVLRKVHSSIGEKASLAVAVPPDWTPTEVDIPKPPRIEPGTIWDEAYKQRVALIADQVVVTAYNSGLSTSADYSAWMAYQVKTFTSALAGLQTADGIPTSTELLIGVPAYDTQALTHDTNVENIPSAVAGIHTGLTESAKSSKFVKGIAIYFESQMSDEDWSQLQQLWSN
ncbi:MAG: hypothetical protein GC179_04930 [Anaerolineaceae bacterium]|nr:hypothetical protein [Anaerolineaceae bacterium]